MSFHPRHLFSSSFPVRVVGPCWVLEEEHQAAAEEEARRPAAEAAEEESLSVRAVAEGWEGEHRNLERSASAR